MHNLLSLLKQIETKRKYVVYVERKNQFILLGTLNDNTKTIKRKSFGMGNQMSQNLTVKIGGMLSTMALNQSMSKHLLKLVHAQRLPNLLLIVAKLISRS